MVGDVSISMKDLDRWVFTPVTKMRNIIQKKWGEATRGFEKWSHASLPAKWHTLAKRCFNAAPVAIVTAMLPPTIVAIGLAGGYLIHHGFGPFSNEVCDACILGTGLGMGASCVMSITEFAANYNPKHLFFAAISGLASRALLMQSRVLR